jgi:SNF2 family DNA or RNA helicase
LLRHQQEGTISVFRHHAKSKLADISQIEAVNVVLTTYHSLSVDWKASKAGESNIMFLVRWKRIILDEAHIISNMKSQLARAVCGLEATTGWAVTGTPIQNHINDLAALLKFIRVYPYDDSKRFEADISRLWKSGDDKEAVERLKRLAGCLILRRSQRTVDLP